jgi:hypothetical protein
MISLPVNGDYGVRFFNNTTSTNIRPLRLTQASIARAMADRALTIAADCSAMSLFAMAI